MKMNERTRRIGQNTVTVVMSLIGVLAVSNELFKHHADVFDYAFAALFAAGWVAGVILIRIM